MDLHDVTEKANLLGKERGILQMDDYDEIVGTAEEINETRFSKPTGSPYEQKDLYAQELFGTEYFNWLDFWEQFHIVQKYKLDRSIITKEGKEVNLKVSKLSPSEYQKAKKLKDFKASDWKWNANEDLYTKLIKENKDIEVGDIVSKKYASTDEDYTKEFKVIGITGMRATLQDTKTGKQIGIALSDLTKIPMKEATTDYMKRRQAQDDYAVNKKDKPKVPTNPTLTGKTDYMKRREVEKKSLEERITEAFNKINEDLCPAGKAYIKRRQAAGEKSSAYLSGRAVKVCKGQMSGKKKKK
jgi:hypothetical protein